MSKIFVWQKLDPGIFCIIEGRWSSSFMKWPLDIPIIEISSFLA